jgi:hypothetical protein
MVASGRRGAKPGIYKTGGCIEHRTRKRVDAFFLLDGDGHKSKIGSWMLRGDPAE